MAMLQTMTLIKVHTSHLRKHGNTLGAGIFSLTSEKCRDFQSLFYEIVKKWNWDSSLRVLTWFPKKLDMAQNA